MGWWPGRAPALGTTPPARLGDWVGDGWATNRTDSNLGTHSGDSTSVLGDIHSLNLSTLTGTVGRLDGCMRPRPYYGCWKDVLAADACACDW